MPETVELVLRCLAAQIMVFGLLYVAHAVSARLLPQASLSLRWLGTCVVGMWLSTAGFHLLRWIEAFTLPAALGLTLVAIGAVRFGLQPRDVIGTLRDEIGRAAAMLRPADARWTRSAPALVAVAAVLLICVRATLVPVVSWDALTYHAVKAGLWVQGGGAIDFSAPGGWSIYRGYPGGGEVFHAWAMLPMRNDLLTGVVDAVQWLGIGLAAYALGKQLQLDRAARWAAVAYLMAIPAVARAVGSLYVDNALTLALLAALVFALRAVRSREANTILFCLAALGVALGTKIFAAPVAALLVPSLFVLLWPASARPAMLARFAAGGVAASICVMPWLVDNWRVAGYPLSPLPVSVAGLTLGEANEALTWMMDRPLPEGLPYGGELHALAALFGLPGMLPLSTPTLGILTVVPLILSVVALGLWARRNWQTGLLLAVFVAPLLIAYYGQPMTAMRLFRAGVSGRYLVAVAGVMVVASLTCWTRRAPARKLYEGFLLLGAAAYFLFSDVADWAVGEIVIAVLALPVLAVVAPAVRRFGWAVLPVAAVALTVALGAYRDFSRETSLATTTVQHSSPRYWTEAASRVDDSDEPANLALTAGPSQSADNWMMYHFLGSGLQNRLSYVPVTRDAIVIDFSRYQDRVDAADFDSWLGRLREKRIEHVMSFQPRSLELVWMEQRPRLFSRIEGDGRSWGLYRLVPASGS